VLFYFAKELDGVSQNILIFFYSLQLGVGRISLSIFRLGDVGKEESNTTKTQIKSRGREEGERERKTEGGRQEVT